MGCLQPQWWFQCLIHRILCLQNSYAAMHITTSEGGPEILEMSRPWVSEQTLRSVQWDVWKYLGFHLNVQVHLQIDKTAVTAAWDPRSKGGEAVLRASWLSKWCTKFFRHYQNDHSKKGAPDLSEWAFGQIEAVLCGGLLLYSPGFSLSLLMHHSALTGQPRAILDEMVEGEERLMVFITWKLLVRETKHSMIEKEGLTIIKWVVFTVQLYLLGLKFTLCSDYTLLQWFHHMKDASAWITHWLLALSHTNSRWSTGWEHRWWCWITSPRCGEVSCRLDSSLAWVMQCRYMAGGHGQASPVDGEKAGRSSR